MKLGDYVTASLISGTKDEKRTVQRTVQGVVTEIRTHDIVLCGELGEYLCEKEATVVNDSTIITKEFVNTLRRQNSLDWYGSLDYPEIG